MRLAAGAVQAGAPPSTDFLFLLEHPPVVTLGRSADRQNILAAPAWLESQGFEVHETDRGGDVTYHGPGQVVGYPVLDLSDRPDVRRYVGALEEAMIRTCADHGLAAGRHPEHRGCWVGSREDRRGGRPLLALDHLARLRLQRPSRPAPLPGHRPLRHRRARARGDVARGRAGRPGAHGPSHRRGGGAAGPSPGRRPGPPAGPRQARPADRLGRPGGARRPGPAPQADPGAGRVLAAGDRADRAGGVPGGRCRSRAAGGDRLRLRGPIPGLPARVRSRTRREPGAGGDAGGGRGARLRRSPARPRRAAALSRAQRARLAAPRTRHWRRCPSPACAGRSSSLSR